MKTLSRLALLAGAAGLLALPSCESGGGFTVLGYHAGQDALYDCNIHTVRVPIFQNRTYIRGLEFELTRAVVREIETKTPFKVVGADCNADTELTGTIINFTKGTLNVNQLNEIREQETDMTVEVVWRDLRTGQMLSDPTRRPDGTSGPALPALPGAAPIAGTPGLVPPGTISTPGLIPPTTITAPTSPAATAATAAPAAPVLGPDGKPVLGPNGLPIPAPASGKILLTSTGDFIPELGQSVTSARQQNVDRMAVQIASMMEKPW